MNPEKERPPREVTILVDPESEGRWIRILGWGPGLGNKLWSGDYRLVYGIPRALRTQSEPEKVLFEASYEIEGRFDAETIRWNQGKMRIEDMSTGEISEMDVEDWSFSLYEGDKLYFADGKLLLSCEFGEELK